MILSPHRHGEPLAALGLIVGGWIVARVLFLGVTFLPASLAEPAERVSVVEEAEAAAEPHALLLRPLASNTPELSQAPIIAPAPVRFAAVVSGDLRPSAPPASIEFPLAGSTSQLVVSGPPMKGPSQRLAPFEPTVHPDEIEKRGLEKRWSADGWMLLRSDGKERLGPLPTYGASQAGAVARYRLALDSGHRPAAYLRAALALDGSGQKESAGGLSARPLAKLPVVAAGELRVTSDRFGTRVRPAAMAYTELSPFDVAAGLRGEVYLQGGYVAGKGATGFADGQARLDRQVIRIGRGEMRVGGGVWGGAQKGASRLDVGPTAQVLLPLSKDVFARAGIDWRFRAAGDATPSSGPALTISAGF
jgi:hypothetical protein